MKKLKLFLNLVIVSFFIISCSSLKQNRKLASDEVKPRHIIFLVHGIAASDTTFGSMSEALLKHLSANQEYETVIKKFIYETHSNSTDTAQFAKDLGNTINQYFLENGEINPQDKISLVAHSQGGIVSLLWLFKATMGEEIYYPKYLAHIDSYITLGTPFWGAKIAVFGDTIKKMGEKFKDDFIPYYGDQQLEDMSFGSSVIFNFRKNAISPSIQEMLEKIKEHVRPINFGGAASALRFLTPFAVGVREYEDDSAVPLPSSRYDFIYASSLKKNYEANETLPASEFSETHFAPYYVVDALHVSTLPTVPIFSALADIPKTCIENANCNHPTFKYVLAHLSHKDLVPDEKRLSKMTSYILDLSIKLSDGDLLDASKIKIELSSDDRDLKKGGPMEFYSNGYKNNIGEQSYRNFYFTGTSDHSYIPLSDRKNSIAFKDKILNIKISSPGYKTRLVKAKMRATYSTFIEINLEK